MAESFFADAYCGLYCGACPSYQATRSGAAEMLGLDSCRGCKSNDISDCFCSICDIKSCAKERSLDFCCDCIEYPCSELLELKENAKVPTHNEILVSLDYIKREGKEKWFRLMEERWRCSHCNSEIHFHAHFCTYCGKRIKRAGGIRSFE